MKSWRDLEKQDLLGIALKKGCRRSGPVTFASWSVLADVDQIYLADLFRFEVPKLY